MPTIKSLLSNCYVSHGDALTANEVPYMDDNGRLLKSVYCGSSSYYDESVFKDGKIYREAVSCFNKESENDVNSIFDVDVDSFVKFICERYSNEKWAEKHFGDSPESVDVLAIRTIHDVQNDVMLNNALLNSNMPTGDKSSWRVTKDGLPASLISKDRRECYSNGCAIVSPIMMDEGLNQLMMSICSGIQKHQDLEILNAIDKLELPKFNSPVDRDTYSASLMSLASTILSRNPNIDDEGIKDAVKKRALEISKNIGTDSIRQSMTKFRTYSEKISIKSFNDSLKYASSIIATDGYKKFIEEIERGVDEIKKSSPDNLRNSLVEEYINKNQKNIRSMYDGMAAECSDASCRVSKCFNEECLYKHLCSIRDHISKSDDFSKNASLLLEFSNVSIHGLFSPEMNRVGSKLGLGKSFSYGKRPHFALKIKTGYSGDIIDVGCLEDLLDSAPQEGLREEVEGVTELSSVFGKSPVICAMSAGKEDKLKELYKSYSDILFEPKNYYLSYSKDKWFKLNSAIQVEFENKSIGNNSESVKLLATNIITEKVKTIEISKPNMEELLTTLEKSLKKSGALKVDKGISVGDAFIAKNANGEVELTIGETRILGAEFYNKAKSALKEAEKTAKKPVITETEYATVKTAAKRAAKPTIKQAVRREVRPTMKAESASSASEDLSKAPTARTGTTSGKIDFTKVNRDAAYARRTEIEKRKQTNAGSLWRM